MNHSFKITIMHKYSLLFLYALFSIGIQSYYFSSQTLRQGGSHG